MKYVLVKDLEPGMIAEEEVTDLNGRVLVEANSAISQYVINKLVNEGFEGVFIVEDLSLGSQMQGTERKNLWGTAMENVKRRNIDACKKSADEIVEALWGKKDISFDLSEYRTEENYIYAHSVSVAVLCNYVGIGFDLKGEELRNLVFAALIHDLGKLDIPPSIRNKAGRLTRDEFQIMKNHSTLSYELIKNRSDISAQVKTAVRSHHENVDGSGYPDGTVGEAQSLHTKILHVADVYDALISQSPYKKAYSPQEAAEYLMGGCGLLFDKEVVTVLLKVVPMFPKGKKVFLSDGRVGMIVENTGVHNLRPVVYLEDGRYLDLSEPEYFNMTVELAEAYTISEEYEIQRKEMLGQVARQRILVVDDMKTNLQMLEDILSDEYEVILAKSGLRAISYIEKMELPDLIIMDIKMPGIDGIETAKMIHLKTGGKKIPLMFVTSLCDKETVMRCRELKPESYIVRPYNPVYVKTEVKRILEGWGHWTDAGL